MGKLSLEIVPHGTLGHITLDSVLEDQIRSAQVEDEEARRIIRKISLKDEGYKQFRQDETGKVYYGDQLIVPADPSLKKQILDEAHLSKFSIHPGSNKMYHDLRQTFWWSEMKPEITRYVSECDTCQRVKASHLKVAGTLQPLPIPSWKWEDISMDFIVGLPLTSQRYDSIWVIVDRLTKSAYFLPVCTTHTVKQYAELYLDRIVSLHGVPKTIISDRGVQFVARFWEQLQASMGTKLIRSSTYHPQTDGQTERVN